MLSRIATVTVKGLEYEADQRRAEVTKRMLPDATQPQRKQTESAARDQRDETDQRGRLLRARIALPNESELGPRLFVTEGLPLLAIAPPPSAADQDAAVAAIDIGAIRTMQQDVEFGIRQIVDIALKAVSPAVNDPSTAVTCVDHLGRLLVQLAQLAQLDRKE